MRNDSQIKQATFSIRWSFYLAFGIMVVACIVLIGWEFDIVYFRQPFPRLVSMNPLTAILFFMTAVSFLLMASKNETNSKKLTAYFLASGIMITSLLKLSSLAGFSDLAVDRILFTDKLDADVINNLPNSMAPNTAFCFLLAGITIFLLNYQTKRERMPAQYLALIIVLVGILSILGYIYGVKIFYGVLSYIPMALHSALCFSAFSFAVLLRHSHEGLMKELTATYTGSTAAKILIPVVIGVPAILGLLRVHAERQGIVSFEFGTAVLVVSIIIVFLIVTWYVTVLLNRKDKMRIIAEKELHASRKQLEKMNEELEEKIRIKTIEIRETFERVSDVFYAIDAEEKFTFVNSKAAELMRKEPHELIGRLVWDIIPKENTSTGFLEAYDRARQTKEYQMVESFSSLAGRWFNIDIYPSVAGVSIFLRDVTEKKKALDAAEKERTLYASIIQSLPGIFYFYDDTGKFLGWNKNFETVSGYTGEEISHMTPDQFFADDEKEYIKSRIGLVFSDGVSDAEANFLSKDGTKTYHYFTGVKLEYERRPCLMGVGIDISDLKRTEAELEKSNTTLRQLTSHLQEIREEERKHIAREIHDELGQQLTVIKMDVSWIRKKTDPANNLILDKIKELTQILDETVHTVRRISSGLRPSLLDDLGLAAAMEWYLNDFRQRTGIDILFNLPKQEIQLPDSINTCLFRILQESLTNVARHADAKQVTVNLNKDEYGITMIIQDDGKGYDAENSSAKRTLGITGMKERAAVVGGKYTINGNPGQGTIICIEVPAVQYLSTKNELI